MPPIMGAGAFLLAVTKQLFDIVDAAIPALLSISQ